MGCGCSSLGNDGKKVADLVREKGFQDMHTKVEHTITCSCGETFIMNKLITKCPRCHITYAVTPCSSDNKDNIKSCGIDY